MKIKDFEDEHAMQKIAELNVIANQYGWKNININVQTRLVSYAKIISNSAVRMDVYYTTMTITVSMSHPTKGKTQLHRKNVSDKEFEKLLRNPRSHTGKGYYTKNGTAYSKAKERKKT